MTKTRKLTFVLLIAILSMSLIIATVLTFTGSMATADTGDVLALATTNDKCNHDWSHDDATVLSTSGETLSGTYKYYLVGNVELTKSLTITGNIELCLNGYSITVATAENNSSGGNQSSDKSVVEDEKIEVEDKVENKTNSTFGIISVSNSAKFTLYDCSGNNTGSITGGKSTSGGGVYVSSNSTFVMNGGTISDNHALRPANFNGGYMCGGGVCVGGIFEMNGGVITGNSAERGDGVYVESYGTFTMTGGEITSNSGTGVYVSGGVMTMSGGTISGNAGYGVYLLKNSYYTSTFNVEGSPKIFDNVTSSGWQRNVYIPSVYASGDLVDVRPDSPPTVSNGPIYITGALNDGARIGVTLANGTGTFATGWEETYGSPKDYFVADDESMCINLIGAPTVAAHSVTAWSSDEYEHWYECSNCGEERERSAHDYGDKYYVDATEGKHYQVCTEENCGYTIYSEHVSDSGKVTKQPKCNVEGEKIWSCTVCKTELKKETIDALEHNWGEGVVTKQPTATKDGVHTYTCSNCGAKKTEPISTIGGETPRAQEEQTTSPEEAPANGNNSNWYWWIMLIIVGVLVVITIILASSEKKRKG